MKSRDHGSNHLIRRLTSKLMVGSFTIAIAAAAQAQSYSLTYIGNIWGDGTTPTGINATAQVIANSSIASIVTDTNGQNSIVINSWLSGLNTVASYGINDSGEFVGTVFTGTTAYAFVGNVGSDTVKPLSAVAGFSYSDATSINDQGRVVGLYSDGSKTQAFITGANGVGLASIAPLPGYSFDQPVSINSAGMVAGMATDGYGTDEAFIYDSNTQSIGALGALPGKTESFVTGMNDSGEVIGESFGGSIGFEPFITGANGKNMRPLLLPKGAYEGSPKGINGNGQVVGHLTYYSSLGVRWDRAFVTDANGQNVTDLNSLIELPDGDSLVDATGINNAGQIVADDMNGRVYLLTPVPEPQTYASLTAGLLLVAIAVRRKRT